MKYLLICSTMKNSEYKPMHVFVETAQGIVMHSRLPEYAEGETEMLKRYKITKVNEVPGYSYDYREINDYEGEDKTRIDKIIADFNEQAK